jgi:hypothetical protein
MGAASIERDFAMPDQETEMTRQSTEAKERKKLLDKLNPFK